MFNGRFNPKYGVSDKWKQWIAELDLRTCVTCEDLDGKIYALEDILDNEPPLHEHCRCIIDLLSTILSGTATMGGDNGADCWLTSSTAGKLSGGVSTKAILDKLLKIQLDGNIQKIRPHLPK